MKSQQSSSQPHYRVHARSCRPADKGSLAPARHKGQRLYSDFTVGMSQSRAVKVTPPATTLSIAGDHDPNYSSTSKLVVTIRWP